MISKILCVSAFVAFVSAGNLGLNSAYFTVHVSHPVAHHFVPLLVHPAPVFDHSAHQNVDYHAHPKYEWSYGVQDAHTGDHKSQHEVRDGDVVKGSYSVAEADGTLRTVHYTADDHNGFNAVVEKTGYAAPVQKVVAAPHLAPPHYIHH
ncbi:unnamed protein product [Brassicogethes aeneus]|uniref:Uncharacterized protein n=1 Tax=Brassicogethes aeneus TaxID=1431903 RepID=A0A9P0B7Y8_BRAAE|nr:unnamed protein product [Brassicogethes aeneus]